MPVKLTATIFDLFSQTFGRDNALKVVKELENIISDATDYKWATTKEGKNSFR